MQILIYKCRFCNYSTDIKCNLKRHENARHLEKIHEILKNSENVQNVIPNVQNVIPNVQNVIPNVQNVIPNILHCQKCNKIYKTKRHLVAHELKCNKVDNLTCPKCMISFTNRHNKNRHVKANKCKARSIIHARLGNVQNITNNITNNNIQNNNIQNNIVINNFGSERIDHISNEDIKKILTSGMNTIPLYIQKKHFDKNFPENNNIVYTNENKCKVMEENEWLEKDIGLLSNKLIKDNSEVLLLYYDDNKIEIGDAIKDSDIFEHVKDKLILIYNKQDVQKYNQILSKIKDLIKNFKTSKI